ncbi:S1C family serine protease [Salininema proteolyticum]|uniref:Trypsin-like peptidase domain-containing protein n=1 Tax=Salininema proteolyticum TaxID=1607685 RepID=A0ABV8TZI1_9ACTN
MSDTDENRPEPDRGPSEEAGPTPSTSEDAAGPPHSEPRPPAEDATRTFPAASESPETPPPGPSEIADPVMPAAPAAPSDPAEPAAAASNGGPRESPQGEAAAFTASGSPQPFNNTQMMPPGSTPPPPPYGAGAPVGGPPPEPRKKGSAGRVVAIGLVALLLGGAAGGVAGYFAGGGDTTVVQSPSMDAGQGKTYTEIADEVTPSVVAIVAGNSEGSGVVYDENGYIVTNNHVVSGADRVEVRFSDGSSAEGVVKAADPSQDLAVIKVDASDSLRPMEFGDSAGLQVGDVAIAIGSPLGLQGTVTQGIVSSLNRSLSISDKNDQGFGRTSSETLDGLIQTDAAINMGNSGGALVNGSGQLIGINTAIASTESGNIGLGFAIPSNQVEEVVDQLIEKGSVEQGYLGVRVAQVQDGAMVIEVSEGSPAEEAGLRAGDVITAIDGENITTAAEVVQAVKEKQPGDSLSVSFDRDGESQTVEVKLGSE